MYRFNELTTRAKLIAIGEFIRGYKASRPEEDMTIEEARGHCDAMNDEIAYSAKGHFLGSELTEGFYIRQVPSTGEWKFYYFYQGTLKVLDTPLGDKDGVGWFHSVCRIPFKNLGFKKVQL